MANSINIIHTIYETDRMGDAELFLSLMTALILSYNTQGSPLDLKGDGKVVAGIEN